ncbi:hypothetical protein BJY01DRAFT_255125 [Aspergillus pseudoustus]|uniref:Alcohol dehydrogenase-like C-terminal domain-containing protein n=1 Tax=Aspergillus pseudoustus TaxID=1810923 RepID=A0ABR4IMU7_9EURO
MLALNVRLGVPWIDKGPAGGRSDTPILIYSGATAAGLYAIQLAKLAGVKVVTTASLRSHELVKGYGACDAFDNGSPTAVEDIIRKYPNIDRAMDCFSEAALPNSVPRLYKTAEGGLSRSWIEERPT